VNAGAPPKSSRSFSRAMVVGNCVAAWGVIVMAVLRGDVGVIGIVLTPALTLIACLGGGYMGVGHLDFRTAVQAARPEARP